MIGKTKRLLKPRNPVAKELREDRRYEHKVALLKKHKKEAKALTNKVLEEAWEEAHDDQ
jgi:hypothetical protein